VGRPLIEKVVKDHSNLAHAEITREQIFECVPAAEFITLIDLTEKAIYFTDKFIIELNDFCTNFPRITKSLINVKAQKKYGLIQDYSSDRNEYLQNMIQDSPRVDYEILGPLLGLTAVEVEAEFDTGYE
jgi:hypothetical protein